VYPDPDRPRRFGALDAALIAAALGVVAFFWFRVEDVLVYKWDWSFLPRAIIRESDGGGWEPNLLLRGLLTTIRLSLWAMLFASALGLVLGVMASSKRLLPRMVAIAYVGLIRNMPPLVFIFIFYFFLSAQLIPALGIDVWSRNLDGVGRRYRRRAARAALSGREPDLGPALPRAVRGGLYLRDRPRRHRRRDRGPRRRPRAASGCGRFRCSGW
jgi:His/Glu/Gln/Arg/opine family amino acid ABC transporter permease subunit